MRPDPSNLYRYQQVGSPGTGIVWAAGNGNLLNFGFLPQWRCLLFMLSISLLLMFGYWTFQSTAISPFLLEQASQETLTFSNEYFPATSPGFTVENVTSGQEVDEKTEGTIREAIDSHKFNFTSPPASQDALSECPEQPPNLIGKIPVWLDAPGMKQLEKLYPLVNNGGHNWPDECRARHRVAIIVPYRDRETHLRVFLHNLHAVLHRQQLDYAIFVVEQITNQTFNRGKLLNVGFMEAKRLYDWQCFVFHDVDLIPEDDRNLYSCPQQPRHMSVAVDKFKYRLLYSSLFGGAEAVTLKQFQQMNGFSNDFWGWGGEDDDISSRVTYAGFSISRYPTIIARYKMIKHAKETLNPVNGCRHSLMRLTKSRWRRDGLSNLNYRVLSIHFNKLYTNITVDLMEKESRSALRKEHLGKDC